MHNNGPLFSDLVCFSHLRWDFVFQRPQHLLSKFAKQYRVFYIEETNFSSHSDSFCLRKTNENVWVVNLNIHHSGTEIEMRIRQQNLLTQLFDVASIKDYVLWYYTPMPVYISEHLHPKLIIYDCMDELSAFKSAPPALLEREPVLFNKADLVFTGGYSLFHSKKNLHHNIHPFPSSIDKLHFSQARQIESEPADMRSIPHPRFGFFGVIDERFDIPLLREVAMRKPEWQFVIIGPVAKINPHDLPHFPNIHYLGNKSYKDLPAYLSGWDIAMVLFARNESTKFISPTKTPEYLAAGCPVISTSISDVVNPYGHNGLVHIADSPEDFIEAATQILKSGNYAEWLLKVDEFLADNSWDKTWTSMMALIIEALKLKEPARNNIEPKITKKEKIYV